MVFLDRFSKNKIKKKGGEERRRKGLGFFEFSNFLVFDLHSRKTKIQKYFEFDFCSSFFSFRKSENTHTKKFSYLFWSWCSKMNFDWSLVMCSPLIWAEVPIWSWFASSVGISPLSLLGFVVKLNTRLNHT